MINELRRRKKKQIDDPGETKREKDLWKLHRQMYPGQKTKKQIIEEGRKEAEESKAAARELRKMLEEAGAPLSDVSDLGKLKGGEIIELAKKMGIYDRPPSGRISKGFVETAKRYRESVLKKRREESKEGRKAVEAIRKLSKKE